MNKKLDVNVSFFPNSNESRPMFGHIIVHKWFACSRFINFLENRFNEIPQ